jgi:hypothetical protein
MLRLDGPNAESDDAASNRVVPVKEPRQQPNLSAVYVVTVAVLAMIAILVWIAIMPPWYGW